jgi:hypothetical protein
MYRHRDAAGEPNAQKPGEVERGIAADTKHGLVGREVLRAEGARNRLGGGKERSGREPLSPATLD